MKIERNNSRIKFKTKSKGDNTIKRNSQADFKDSLNRANQQARREQLEKLLNLIDQHGERLKRTFDKRDLFEYKKKVKEFLKIIQQEYARAHQSVSWDSRGNLKTYTIIEKIDDTLDSLHQLFLEEEADSLKVLEKIDQIRGLLLDLYI